MCVVNREGTVREPRKTIILGSYMCCLGSYFCSACSFAHEIEMFKETDSFGAASQKKNSENVFRLPRRVRIACEATL